MQSAGTLVVRINQLVVQKSCTEVLHFQLVDGTVACHGCTPIFLVLSYYNFFVTCHDVVGVRISPQRPRSRSITASPLQQSMTHQASPAEVQSVVVAINNLRDAEMGQTHPI